MYFSKIFSCMLMYECSALSNIVVNTLQYSKKVSMNSVYLSPCPIVHALHKYTRVHGYFLNVNEVHYRIFVREKDICSTYSSFKMIHKIIQ